MTKRPVSSPRGAYITAFAQGSEEAQIVIGIRRPSDSPARFPPAPPDGGKTGRSSLPVGVVAATSLGNPPVPVV